MSTGHLAPSLSEDADHWFTRAETWIREAHESLGIGPLESVERIKVRPWSVILRTNSRRAVNYFKASGTGGAHEANLLAWLTNTDPVASGSVYGHFASVASLIGHDGTQRHDRSY